MTWMTLTRVGMGSDVGGATSSSGADPQLQFFENFPGRLANATYLGSDAFMSLHAVNIPLSLSFGKVAIFVSHTGTAGRTVSLNFGLYSLNGGSLSLANMASTTTGWTNNQTEVVWISMNTSATQNISPGAWYFGFVPDSSQGNPNIPFLGNSSINPINAIPGGFLMGRLTASTAALPASIATSDLDITGNDATRQPYIIITA